MTSITQHTRSLCIRLQCIIISQLFQRDNNDQPKNTHNHNLKTQFKVLIIFLIQSINSVLLFLCVCARVCVCRIHAFCFCFRFALFIGKSVTLEQISNNNARPQQMHTIFFSHIDSICLKFDLWKLSLSHTHTYANTNRRHRHHYRFVYVLTN